MSTVDWSSNASSVQESWNDLEYKIINIVDELIPNVDFHGDHLAHKPCPTVKRKLNLRNRLLKSLKKRPTLDLKNRVKNLNVEIRNHFRFLKRNDVRRKIIPGNSKSLWNAVKMSKDNAINSLPDFMTLGGVQVSEHELPSSFAKFFANKVNVITNGVAVDPAVYNGKKKLDAGNHMFMTTNDVKKCLESIKLL